MLTNNQKNQLMLLTKKSYTIMLIKAFDKIQYSIMIKTQKTRNSGELPHLNKENLQPTSYSMVRN